MVLVPQRVPIEAVRASLGALGPGDVDDTLVAVHLRLIVELARLGGK